MSDTQVSALDHAIQQTNVWLKRLAEEHHFRDRQHAYNGLRAVLHALRDRLFPDLAAHLGAQLPIPIRGIYYEGWRISRTPTGERHPEEFLQRVAAELPPQFPLDALTVTRAVLDLLCKELDPGQIDKVVESLPVPLRSLWPKAA